MSTDNLFPLVMNSGVQRDGTDFSSRNYIDALWIRFQRKLPQKIKGYESIIDLSANNLSVPRGTIIVPYNGLFYIYFGTKDGIYYVTVDENLNVITPLTNVTPEGFVSNEEISWTFSLLSETVSNSLFIIAHPGYNLNNINNRIESPVYFGEVGYDDLLIPTGQLTSGGIVVMGARLLILKNDGLILVSEPNKPNVFNDLVGYKITSQKLVAGRETRSAQSRGGPSALIWSIDGLFKFSSNGDPLTLYDACKIGDASLISNNSIAEMDSLFFWVGIDKLMFYNGLVNTLPNDNNSNFFFDNINMDYQTKTWAAVVPRYDEVWIFFPKGESTECNWAIIFNKRTGEFYDTAVERTCGSYTYAFKHPIWLSYETLDENIDVKVWAHERGLNRVETVNNLGNPVKTSYPIEWYCKTGSISLCAIDPMLKWQGAQKQIILQQFEPDFIQKGPINLQIVTKQYANSVSVDSTIFTINEGSVREDIYVQGREINIIFGSNVIDSYFEMGNPILNIAVGDARP